MDCLDLLAVQGILNSLLPTPQVKSIVSSALSFLQETNFLMKLVFFLLNVAMLEWGILLIM